MDAVVEKVMERLGYTGDEEMKGFLKDILATDPEIQEQVKAALKITDQ